MIRACLAALLSHWRRNPLQLFALLGGLTLATALWAGVQAINAEARASYAAASDTLGEGQFDQLVPRSGAEISLETYVALRRAGWLVSPVVEAPLGNLRLLGVDPLTAPGGLGAAQSLSLQTETVEASAPFRASADTAARIGPLDTPLPITVDEQIAPGIIVGDLSDVLAWLDRETFSRLIVLPEQPRRQAPLADVAPELQRIASSQTADIGQLTDSFHLNLTAFGLLSFVVGLFIVHSTIGLAFEQRRGMVRTLRSLGVPLQTLMVLMAVEMLVLALIGAGLGVIAGYAIAAALLPDVAATLRGLYGAEVSGTLQLRPEWWLSALALTLAGTVLALGDRLWRVARMPLLASVRPRSWAMVDLSALRIQGFVALVLLVIAAGLGAVADSLIEGFATLGALLLGAALAFPVLADLALRRANRRARAPLVQWFWADTRQQIPGLSLALMALLLAVSANIGVATMVSSFRLTFVGFLDQRLAPELYLQVETQEESAALEGYLLDRGIETLPLLRSETLIGGRSVDLLGIRVGPTYRNAWVFLDQSPEVWDEVAAGTALILNEQFARRADLWVGDTVAITPERRLPIAAVVGDYGNPAAQVIASEAVVLSVTPDLFPRQFGARTDDPGQLAQDITDALGLSPNAMIDQARLKAGSLAVFERTFLVTGALNVLTLGVAGFAILMSLLTLADLRLPQLAPVWALGLTRRRLGGLEMLRALALGGFVFLCAVPVGLALAWVLLAIVNVAAFGWRLPMFLFPADYAMLGVYTLLAALLAASWPVSRLVRTPPSALLRVFSVER